jgi:type IV secretion system protein VirB10
MITSLYDNLKRHTARLFGGARSDRETGAVGEYGARSSVPGRQDAAESTLNPLRGATLSTPTLLGVSLLAAAFLGWYYVHAYTRAHATERSAPSHTAELADSPLPPLEHADISGVGKEKLGAHHYAIGDILGPTEGADGTDVAIEERDGEGRAPSEPEGATALRGAGPQLPQVRRLDGAVFARTASPAEATVASVAGASWKIASPSANASGEANPVDRLLRSEVTPATAASVLPTQRLLLPKGAFLDCTLETAIDSTLPGLTTCVTAFDTFSADGTVVLLERGTKLIGEMRSQVQQGTARVFVLWTEARTPKGIVVALASPGTDELGRSGLPGTVDRHFADRFGAAILVSMIGGAIQSAVNHSQGNGGTVILNPSGAGDVATEVLRSTLNIPPTVRIPQGERIEVLVARDLDFRSVYNLQAR